MRLGMGIVKVLTVLLLLSILLIDPVLYGILIGTFCYLYIYIHTVRTESIQTPLNFSLFVILQPFAKII